MLHVKYSKKKKKPRKWNQWKRPSRTPQLKKILQRMEHMQVNKVRGYYPVPKRCSITICGRNEGHQRARGPTQYERKHSQWKSRCCPDPWFLFHFFLEEQERSHITLGLLSHWNLNPNYLIGMTDIYCSVFQIR